jgi:oxygen-independent coproporphyrinogen-3 oxidase
MSSAVAVDLDLYNAPGGADVPRAVYFHVPFCLHRCGYCDFTLIADRDELIPAYLEALGNELATQRQVYDVDTIFIGGGTPTHLSAGQLDQLLSLISEHFRLQPEGEYSIEANPDGLEDEQLRVLRQHGVNRLSLGVQSFDDSVLQFLERQHSGREAMACVERASEVFAAVSVDLIFGVPGQTPDGWSESLAVAAQLPISHVSTYGLTYEKGTQFYGRMKRGALLPVDDQVEREMYAGAIEFLTDQGFGQYEISNFARPGWQCRHNKVYWAADPYWAFGPGAARYVDGVRSTNSRNVSRWINSWLKHIPAIQEREQLSATDSAREAIMLGLRRCEGLAVAEFEARFGCSPEQLAAEAMNQNLARGYLELVDGYLRLTSEGRFLADSVVIDFL